jgi:hypothetical protein
MLLASSGALKKVFPAAQTTNAADPTRFADERLGLPA